MTPGEGVTAVVDGKTIKAGNLKLLAEHITLSQELALESGKYLNEGSTVIYVAVDNKLAGYIVLADTVRSESAGMITRLHDLGVKPVLLTGDNVNAATTIGQKLGIADIHANCLPEDKLNHIGDYQQKGEAVCICLLYTSPSPRD